MEAVRLPNGAIAIVDYTGTPYDRLTNRREAIALALSTAGRGDTVLIAGKGSEEYQIIGDRTLPFQDIAVVHQLTSTT